MQRHGDLPTARKTPRSGLPWPDAREAARRLGRRCGPGQLRWETLTEALGGVLADELQARIAAPPYDAAAMDGYAVCGPGPWTLHGRVLAGQEHDLVLSPGQAVEVATGARVPEGTTAVLPYEHARRNADVLAGDIAPGRHVRRRGEETPEGAVVLPAGTVITPAVLGLAASLAHDRLPVYRPRVRAVVSGDELVDEGVPSPGAVRDAIGPMLPGLVAAGGGVLTTLHRIPDGLDALTAQLATEGDESVLVVCGASSVGPADYLRGALVELGAEVLVDGVHCRPGHPQLLAQLAGGRHSRRVVVGLPGNPGAALAASLTLLLPLLCAMTGRAETAPGRITRCRLDGEVTVHEHDTRLVAVEVLADRARPVGHDRPASLRGAAAADAVAVVPPRWAGDDVELLWLPV